MNDATRSPHTLRAAAFASLAGTVLFSFGGCKNHAQAAQVVASSGADPAAANLAQPYTGGSAGGYTTGGPAKAQVLGQSQTYNPQTTAETYETQEPAPIIRQAPQGTAGAPTQFYPVPQAGTGQASYNGDPNAQEGAYPQPPPQSYSDAEEAGEQALAETDQAPPPLPEYDQPAAPADDYIWNPGYWNYASTGYFWVPGIWCAPPFVGALWTPPYWAYDNRHYRFHRGYWGPHVGYYGGINYGFGYVGYGYYGGYWHGRDFYYNRAVTNVNVERVHNVYQRTVVLNGESFGPRPNNRISYNGGPGGLRVQPRPEELGAMREAHYAPLPVQRDNRLAAAANRSQFFNVNRGRPAEAFATHPLGNPSNIPAAPGSQGFPRAGEQTVAGSQRSAQPTVNQHPGALNRPGANPAQTPLYNRPGEPGRQTDGTARSGGGFRSGTPSQATYNPQLQPATPIQPGVTYVRPGQFDRPTAPNQPGVNYRRPGDLNSTTTPNQPTLDTGRPFGRPDRPAETNQPGFNGGRPVAAQPAVPLQPAYGQQENLNRPGGTGTPNYPTGFRRDPGQPGASYPTERVQPRATYARPAPATQGYQAQRAVPPQAQPQTQPQAQPNFQERRSFQPQTQLQGQPNFQEPRPTQPQGRPSFQEQRPSPAFEHTPQAGAPRPAAPPAPATQGYQAQRAIPPQAQPQTQPQAQPNFQERRSFQPQTQPQGQPSFQEPRPIQPQGRPSFQEQRPSPALERAPQAGAPRPAAPPAPAPHAEAPQSHTAPAVNNGRPH